MSDGWMECVDPYGNAKDYPSRHKWVEVRRVDDDKIRVVEWSKLPPQMNIGNLLWRPVSGLTNLADATK